jgi:hypothetical protein
MTTGVTAATIDLATADTATSSNGATTADLVESAHDTLT